MNALPSFLSNLPPVAIAAIAGFVVLNAVIGLVTYVTLLERKFAARMQSRIGPYRVGPHGLLQPIADAVKLMMKEDIVPTAADRTIFNLAPIVFLIPCMLIFATIPFAPGLGVADLNIGVLFFLAVSSMEIVGLFMAGWGSNNKYALISAMRAVNQIISYDLPFIFAAIVPVLLTGSLQLSAIAEAQSGLWFAFYPVIGQLAFLAFIVSSVAAENRVPFDILEAESELVAGFRVEYSGMKFALIQLWAHRAWAPCSSSAPGLVPDPLGLVQPGFSSRRSSSSCSSPGCAGASCAFVLTRSSPSPGSCYFR
jgi:NADH-quinone oxidoreductase subunit H